MTTFADGATVTLSAACGEVGDSLTVQGLGFWPNVETQLWWANPIGQEQRLTSDGQPIIVTTGDRGEFQADITVPQAVPLSADTGERFLPVVLTLCETNPDTGTCINPEAPALDPVVVDMDRDATHAFAIVVRVTDTVALDPANNRVFVRFTDASGQIRGSTSVAIQGQIP